MLARTKVSLLVACWLALSAWPVQAGKSCKVFFRGHAWVAQVERCPNGLAEGRGRAEGRIGMYYEGSFRRGLFHGQGTLVMTPTWTYKGQFRAGKMSGKGELTMPDGTTYRGGFLNDEYHGQGEEVIADGSHYSGGWRHGRMQGRGTFRMPDGTRYQGRFDQNRMVGKVTVTDPDGRRRVESVPPDTPAWRVSDMSAGRMVDGLLERADRMGVDRQPTPRSPAPTECVKLPWDALRGDLESLRKLLSMDCPADQADGDGRTGLHMAVVAGRADVLELLLEHGADPARPDNNGQSAVQLAEQLGRLDLVRRLSDPRGVQQRKPR